MSRAKESALTDAQIASIKIDKLIFHVIQADQEEGDKVTKLSEVVLDQEQTQFFIERIQSVSKGIQYNFNPDTLSTKEACATLLNPDKDFNSESVKLTSSFAQQHRGHMANGVFVVSTVTIKVAEKEELQLLFLAKFDYRKVYEITVKAREDGSGDEVIMKKIAANLVEDKSAIQKSALVDISETFSWDILADERRLKANGEVTDYFKAFLGAILREVASVLTKRAVTLVNKIARELDENNLPEGAVRGDYRARAVAYMETSDEYDSDDFLNSVVKDDDPKRREETREIFKKELELAGLTNQKFVPKPKSLPKSQRKQVWRTAEGLEIEIPGETADFGLNVEHLPGNQGVLIQIQTQRYEVKK
ncbi:nucleoid-associated protein [Pseudoalteromonas luteoviolacea]|uniref:nucleoid-associated protein n=1 Tax=Pseudoalteromonas luteoviolacea TaxID=43657 RepID=UPI001F2D381C|nr:nucleoid-associated protein [Pseudoalteromonas luteoviolacea]MCF6441052.1 nucleoid-associated protein [Pseudoalteromonas luteoviolacea]